MCKTAHPHFLSSFLGSSLQISFLAGIDRKDQSDLTCGVVAGLIQYFALTTFLWLLVEGYHVYVAIMTWQSASDEATRLLRYYLVGAWGLPLVIIGVTAGLSPRSYGTADVCWLAPESSAVLFSFLLPLGIMLATNLTILLRAVCFIRKDEKMKGRRIVKVRMERGRLLP